MLLILIGLVFGAPILWTVSVGAVREARRMRQQDPRTGCQEWVAIRGLRGRLYRCGEPICAGGSRCLRHERGADENTEQTHPDSVLIDEPQAVGRALALARIGVPLAIAASVAAVVLLVWALQRAA